MLNTEEDALICSALRGESPNWPTPESDSAALDAFQARAELHGVQSLLHSQLVNSDWPVSILQKLRHSALEMAMWELRHQHLLTETLGALFAKGIEPVLIKGTALAYSLYPNPVLRTRADTDLIVPLEHKVCVHEVLESLGFERSAGMSGEFVSYETNYVRESDGAIHTLDVHWKISNSEVLSGLFSYEELRRDAESLSALCAKAWGTSRVHALLLACMHRATHKQNPYYVEAHAHHEPDRLIWLYDIHLLSEKLSASEWTVFLELVVQKGLCAVCLEGMRRAKEWFHTAYPDSILPALTSASSSNEEPARYLNGSKLAQQSMDFWALEGWQKRLLFLRELFFPPEAFIRSKYPERPETTLTWLYLRRATHGIAKRLRRSQWRA